jgi:hypothetical protein
MIKIPFFPNDKTDLHCMHACMQMILKYYYPDKKFSISRLNKLLKIGNKKMYGFPEMEVVVLSDLGINAKYYSSSDDRKWYNKGKEYLLEKYQKEVAEDIWKMTNFKIQKPFFVKALKEKRFIHKKLSFEDLEAFFKKGYLVSPTININALENKKGYAGHAVLITDIDKKFITFHDPGLLPMPDSKIKKKYFIKAWKSAGTDNTVVVVLGNK